MGLRGGEAGAAGLGGGSVAGAEGGTGKAEGKAGTGDRAPSTSRDDQLLVESSRASPVVEILLTTTGETTS